MYCRQILSWKRWLLFIVRSSINNTNANCFSWFWSLKICGLLVFCFHLPVSVIPYQHYYPPILFKMKCNFLREKCIVVMYLCVTAALKIKLFCVLTVSLCSLSEQYADYMLNKAIMPTAVFILASSKGAMTCLVTSIHSNHLLTICKWQQVCWWEIPRCSETPGHL